MKIGLHGGNCCGVKHIYELGFYPPTPMAARKANNRTSFGQKDSNAINDMWHKNPRAKSDFFNEKAPVESAEQRFRRFVSFIKDNRPHGIVEVVLNKFQKAWIPILEDVGFKGPVSEGNNSNTSQTIYIYHLVY